MRIRVGLVSLLAFIGLSVGFGRTQAQPADHHEETAEHHDEATPAAEHHDDHAAPAEHHDDKAAPAEHHDDHAAPEGEHHDDKAAEHHDDKAAGEHHDDKAAEHHDDKAAEHHDAHADHAAAEHHEGDAAAAPAEDIDEDGVPTHEFDLEGTGHDDPQLKKEYDEAFAGIHENIDTDAVDKELEERLKNGTALSPSVSVEQFRKAVAMARKVVLAKMEKKIEAGIEKKMTNFSIGVFILSLCGIFLLAIPLVKGKQYPGKGGVLWKYSAFAALVFFITVNLFGGVLMGMRTVQGHLGKFANPSLAIAAGTFDTLDANAEQYSTMGKELFLPTIESLRGNTDAQPVELLLENGQKIVKDAMVFVSVAKMVKRLDWVFKLLPLILFGVTMLLFAKAVKPTLTEIVKLPMRVAGGEASAGRDTTKRAIARVIGELKATLVTISALAVITVVSAFVLGEVVAPVLDTLVNYFYLAILYLQFVENPSSGLVFVALMGVVFFLVLNLATLILSSVFFLGKTQKIFQARFNDGVSVRTHKHFFKWGIPAVLFVQFFPWIFMLVADKLLEKIYSSMIDGPDLATWAWGKIFLVGPIVLIVGYGLMFWGARGVKAVAFLFKYKVTPPVPVPPSAPAEPV